MGSVNSSLFRPRQDVNPEPKAKTANPAASHTGTQERTFERKKK